MNTDKTTTYTLPPNVTYHRHQQFRVENWLIIGTGPTVEEDWEAICKFPAHFLARSEIVLINRAQLPPGMSLTHAHHHVTYHSDHYHIANPGIQAIPRRHSNIAMPYTTDCWLIPDDYHVGGSAFLAAYIAKQLGVRRAILIGCPMTGGPEHTQLVDQLTAAPCSVWAYYRSVVSSMSGNTRTLFGAPSTLDLNAQEEY